MIWSVQDMHAPQDIFSTVRPENFVRLSVTHYIQSISVQQWTMRYRLIAECLSRTEEVLQARICRTTPSSYLYRFIQVKLSCRCERALQLPTPSNSHLLNHIRWCHLANKVKPLLRTSEPPKSHVWNSQLHRYSRQRRTTTIGYFSATAVLLV